MVVGCVPPGPLKIVEISVFFRKLFEWASGGHLDAKMIPQGIQGAEKGSEKATLGCLLADFWLQSCNIGTLLEHCYLLHF